MLPPRISRDCQAWSKALGLGPSTYCFAGSNPAPCTCLSLYITIQSKQDSNIKNLLPALAYHSTLRFNQSRIQTSRICSLHFIIDPLLKVLISFLAYFSDRTIIALPINIDGSIQFIICIASCSKY